MTTETLGQKQRRFTRLVGLLIQWCYENGYELTFGQALRTQLEADANAASGAGIKNSLHLIRLAVDFELFKDGEYLTQASDYAPLGSFWKSLGDDCRHGGDFAKPDADHFSIEHDGVK